MSRRNTARVREAEWRAACEAEEQAKQATADADAAEEAASAEVYEIATRLRVAVTALAAGQHADDDIDVLFAENAATQNRLRDAIRARNAATTALRTAWKARHRAEDNLDRAVARENGRTA